MVNFTLLMRNCAYCNKEILPDADPKIIYCNKSCRQAKRRRGLGIPIRKTLEERFLKDIEYDPNSGCWLWSGRLCGSGYARIFYDGKYRAAHRYSYSIHKGEIPSGLILRHTCDTKCCVNPSHLIAGTYKENTMDMFRRQAPVRHRGERAGPSKLTERQAREIKASAYTMTCREMGDIYGVSPCTIHAIWVGRNWKHI